MDLLEHLKSRNLFFQSTPENELRDHLSQSRVVYAGFDPTAPSLHIGHLLPLIILNTFKEFGHTIVPVVGSFTAKIGDPTGKSKERNALDTSSVNQNRRKIHNQINSILDVVPRDNNDWHFRTPVEEFLSISKFFNVRQMLASECFEQRLNGDNGLSFLEFSYMIFQAWDFLILNEDLNCTIQVGGSDQWSNMLAGIDLIRKENDDKAFCITSPLFLDSNGKKMGKTEEGNTIWLDRELTNDFEFFQFWRNLPDCLVDNALLQFTKLNINDFSNINLKKEALAFEVTKFVRGEESANAVLNTAKNIFNNHVMDTTALPEIKIDQKNINIIDLLKLANITKSKTEARNLIQNGGITVNGNKVEDVELNLILNEEFIIGKGKKSFFKIIHNI